MNDLSPAWSYYISAMVVLSILWVTIVLLSQNKVKLKKGEKAEVLPHVWDENLQEYNNPLPLWWLVMFILTIVFSIAYLIAYPGMGSNAGIFGWSSAGQYKEEVKAVDEKVAPVFAQYAAIDIPTLAKNKEAMASGRSLFGAYCMQCHGTAAKGAKGFPNLTDDIWLWGGDEKAIHTTIANGRVNAMPAQGKNLGEAAIYDVAQTVMSFSGNATDMVAAERGKATFAQVCAACHGVAGKGNQAIGAPNLTDNDWLYAKNGQDQKTIVDVITNGRNNQMPAWEPFIGKDRVHVLTAYVWSLSNKDKLK
jgi:cytochrome c oxidase cbb3-type subunit 3